MNAVGGRPSCSRVTAPKSAHPVAEPAQKPKTTKASEKAQREQEQILRKLGGEGPWARSEESGQIHWISTRWATDWNSRSPVTSRAPSRMAVATAKASA